MFDDNSECHDLHRVASLLFSTAINGGMAVVVLRTPQAEGTRVVRVWRVRDLVARSCTGAQSFDAYCFDEAGRLTGPEPGAVYVDAPELV
ncbi:hypothetical protein ACFWBF_37185 [Streptomyces sp. NPDC060028]|uniref:hypothetical protein n=1 Tax=Streptomyces sp. NPDC060028 TaxID=3347041 RepID=UPI0036A1F576